jgi:hypothetical protein
MNWRRAHAPDCRRDLSGYPNGDWKLDPERCQLCEALARRVDRIEAINDHPAPKPKTAD